MVVLRFGECGSKTSASSETASSQHWWHAVAQSSGAACRASIREPMFATLLDDENGGRSRIGPGDGEAGTQRYLTNTNVLETTFQHARRGPSA